MYGTLRIMQWRLERGVQGVVTRRLKGVHAWLVVSERGDGKIIAVGCLRNHVVACGLELAGTCMPSPSSNASHAYTCTPSTICAASHR
jgi:hypothetical protein